MSMAAIAAGQAISHGQLSRVVALYHRHSLQTSAANSVRASEALAIAAAEGATSIDVTFADGAKVIGELPAGLEVRIDAIDFETTLVDAVKIPRGQATVHLELASPLPGPLLGAHVDEDENEVEAESVEFDDSVELEYRGVPISRHKRFGAPQVIEAAEAWTLKGARVPPIGALINKQAIFQVDPFGATADTWRVYAGLR